MSVLSRPMHLSGRLRAEAKLRKRNTPQNHRGPPPGFTLKMPPLPPNRTSGGERSEGAESGASLPAGAPVAGAGPEEPTTLVASLFALDKELTERDREIVDLHIQVEALQSRLDRALRAATPLPSTPPPLDTPATTMSSTSTDTTPPVSTPASPPPPQHEHRKKHGSSSPFRKRRSSSKRRESRESASAEPG